MDIKSPRWDLMNFHSKRIFWNILDTSPPGGTLWDLQVPPVGLDVITLESCVSQCGEHKSPRGDLRYKQVPPVGLKVQSSPPGGTWS